MLRETIYQGNHLIFYAKYNWISNKKLLILCDWFALQKHFKNMHTNTHAHNVSLLYSFVAVYYYLNIDLFYSIINISQNFICSSWGSNWLFKNWGYLITHTHQCDFYQNNKHTSKQTNKQTKSKNKLHYIHHV